MASSGVMTMIIAVADGVGQSSSNWLFTMYGGPHPVSRFPILWVDRLHG